MSTSTLAVLQHADKDWLSSSANAHSAVVWADSAVTYLAAHALFAQPAPQTC